MKKKLFAEALGTFFLVFAGTGAIIVNDVSGGAITHVGISLIFGLIVLSMIYAVGDISGAHLNPAVTLGFYFSKRLEKHFVLPYITSQLAGGFAASILLRILFPDHLTLGATLPAFSVAQAFVFEVLLTGMLMFVILCVSTGAKEKGLTAGIVVGCVIALEAMLGGPISGASMNPARSLAPAIVSMQLAHLWLYVVAPIIGAGFAVTVCRVLRDKDCCHSFCCNQNATT